MPAGSYLPDGLGGGGGAGSTIHPAVYGGGAVGGRGLGKTPAGGGGKM